MMDSGLIAYGLGLLLVTTVFWAAVWWWLPALFRDRDRDDARPRGRAAKPQQEPGDRSGQAQEPPAAPPRSTPRAP
jgi:hypothetical protein